MKPGQQFRNLRILVLAMDGWTGRMLADHFGLTQGFISTIVHRESQKRGIVMGRKRDVSRIKDLALRREAGASWEQLGKEFGVSPKRAYDMYHEALQEGLLQRQDAKRATWCEPYKGQPAAPRVRTLQRDAYSLPRELRHLAERARFQKPLIPMTSNIPGVS